MQSKFQGISILIGIRNGFGIDMLRQSICTSLVDFYSKFELEQIKHRMKFEGLPGSSGEVQKNLPPPNEMYKLLVKQGIKPN